MKSLFTIFLGILIAAGPACAADEPVLKNQKDKVSYTIGVYSGNNLKKQAIEVDPDLMMKGLKDSLSGGKTLLTEAEMQEVMVAFQKDLTAQQTEKKKELAVKNKQEGEAFLAANMKKEGIKTLPSGLQYKVIQDGKGKRPKETDAIVAHYRGTLINGTEFDSSFKRNEPATFRLDGVIKGWKEALLLMNEGAKWQIFIPSDLAYGENGAGPIEPNATLIFDVELISVYTDATGRSQTVAPASKGTKPADKAAKPAAKPSKPAAK